MALNVAAGDVITVGSDGTFDVQERGGNVAVRSSIS
jgi:hypothetical protein